MIMIILKIIGTIVIALIFLIAMATAWELGKKDGERMFK